MTVLKRKTIDKIRLILRDLADDFMTDKANTYRRAGTVTDDGMGGVVAAPYTLNLSSVPCSLADRQLQPEQYWTQTAYEERAYSYVRFPAFTDINKQDLIEAQSVESSEVRWLEVVEVDKPITGEGSRLVTCRDTDLRP